MGKQSLYAFFHANIQVCIGIKAMQFFQNRRYQHNIADRCCLYDENFHDCFNFMEAMISSIFCAKMPFTLSNSALDFNSPFTLK